jgi:Putative prokaryotic signal transducing protein
LDAGNGFVTVFKTGRVYEWDAAKAHLEESGIPCFGQARSATGLVEAFQHPAPGPYVSFALLVPPDRVDRARELLRELGLAPDAEPDAWHFDSSPRARSPWRLLAVIILLTAMLIIAVEVRRLLAG